MADNWVVSPILPSIAGDIGVSPIRTAILITAYMIPFAVFQLLYGPLADRYGKLRVLRWSLIGFTIACGATALGSGLTDLTILRALTGMFAAATMPVSFALIGDTVRMEERQAAIGSFMGVAFLGQGLSMGIGGTIAFLLDWRGVFIAYGVIAAVVTSLLWWRTRGMEVAANPNSKIIEPYRKLVSQWSSLRVYLIVIVEGVLVGGSFSYFGAFLSSQFKIDNLAIGLIMTAYGLAAVFAGRKSGTMANLVGRRGTLTLGLAMAAVGDVLVFALGGALPAIVVALALVGGGFMFAHSTLLTIATEFAAKARGTAMSLVAFCMMGGSAAGTAIGGPVIESTSYTVFYALWGLFLVGLAIAAFIAVSNQPFQPAPNMARQLGADQTS
jgi:predicted MFS family arabinose efflux permease